MSPRIEPGISSVHDLYFEISLFEICGVYRSDFEFATMTRLHVFRDLYDVIGIEIESYDCVFGLGDCWFFFYRYGHMLSIELDDSISFWIRDFVSENHGFVLLLDDARTLTKKYRESVSIEEIVSEDQTDII